MRSYKSNKSPKKSLRIWKFIKSWVCCIWIVKCFTSSPNQISKNSKKKKIPQKEQMNSESKIDNVSRIMFPVVFLLLNVFYWYSYISHSQYFKTRLHPNWKFYKCYILCGNLFRKEVSPQRKLPKTFNVWNSNTSLQNIDFVSWRKFLDPFLVLTITFW